MGQEEIEEGRMMPAIEQRILTLLSNLEAAGKALDPKVTPHFILFLQVKELAEIVKEIVLPEADGPLIPAGSADKYGVPKATE